MSIPPDPKSWRFTKTVHATRSLVAGQMGLKIEAGLFVVSDEMQLREFHRRVEAVISAVKKPVDPWAG